MPHTLKIASPQDRARSRHIRRYVHAPIHRFAAVAPLELTPLCLAEMSSLGIEGAQVSEAGVEFSGRLADCYKANLWLRTPSRILCRLPSFRAGVVEELFGKVLEMRWELWLSADAPLQIDAHVEDSRIEHEGVVKDTLGEAIRKRFRSAGLSAPPLWEAVKEEDAAGPSPLDARQRIIVHLRRNHCEISLDTTGAHLHHRGYRLHHAGAPLRETLAAAILMKSGWRGDSPLVDGMCGAGTLAVEAALIARSLAPALGRHFLFEKWPSFREGTWNFLRREAREKALDASPVPILGVDRDGEALAVARENAERAGVASDIDWQNKDFFRLRPEEYGLSEGLLVLNPPYGKRQEGGDRRFFEDLGGHLRSSFRGWRAVVLAPSRTLAMSLKLGSTRFWHFKHGGIPITAVMARI